MECISLEGKHKSSRSHLFLQTQNVNFIATYSDLKTVKHEKKLLPKDIELAPSGKHTGN